MSPSLTGVLTIRPPTVDPTRDSSASMVPLYTPLSAFSAEYRRTDRNTISPIKASATTTGTILRILTKRIRDSVRRFLP